MASIIYLPLVFITYTLGLYLLAVYGSGDTSLLSVPTSFDNLKEFSSKLNSYSNENPTYLFILFCLFYIWKQSFAIPGSFFMNLLAGSLYGVKTGLCLACLLTAIGATNCYLLSKYIAKDFVKKYFKKQVEFISKKVKETGAVSLPFLVSLRLFPMTPNWMLNICSPILNIPIHLFSTSVLFGLIPYNLVCVQSGTILAQLHTTSDVIDSKFVLKLVMLAALLLTPTIATKMCKRRGTYKRD